MSGKGMDFWAQVRRAYEQGEGGFQELAERFGVSQRAVCRHGLSENWKKEEPQPERTAMREVTRKLHWAALREIARLEEQETDVKTIRDLTALVRELNQLAKSDPEESGGTLRVQWGEETEQWSE